MDRQEPFVEPEVEAVILRGPRPSVTFSSGLPHRRRVVLLFANNDRSLERIPEELFPGDLRVPKEVAAHLFRQRVNGPARVGGIGPRLVKWICSDHTPLSGYRPMVLVRTFATDTPDAS
jgi:hypothetical protein